MIRSVKFIILSLGFVGNGVSYSQDMITLESQRREIQNSLRFEATKLDSLNARLEENAVAIDNEKRSSSPDQNKLMQLMAYSVPISMAIKSQHSVVAQMEKLLDRVSAMLFDVYSLKLDSLIAKRRSASREEDRGRIDDAILLLSEKRLFVSPVIEPLSFDPLKVSQMDLSNSKDSLENTMYRSYLEHALKEIDKRSRELKKASEELSSVLALRRSANEFLEELAEQNGLTNLRAISSAKTGFESNFGSQNSVADRAFSTANLLSQLNNEDRLLLKYHSGLLNSKTTISIQDYLELISHTQSELTKCREIIEVKLK